LRNRQLAWMPNICRVQRKTQIDNGAGGFTDTWSTVVSCACRIGISGKSPEERAIADRIGVELPYTVTLPYDTDVTEKDRLVVGTRVFQVLGVLVGSFETARKCVCMEIE